MRGKKMRKYLIAVALIVMIGAFVGCKGKQAKEDENLLIYEASFNGETIKIKVNHVYDEDDYSFKLESLVFNYQGQEHTINLSDLIESIYYGFGEPDYIFYNLEETDMNFDGYMDILIQKPQEGDNFRFVAFLYNPETKKYYLHEELSDLEALQIDSESKNIHSTIFFSGECDEWISRTYRWEGENLVVIESTRQTVDENNKYKRVTETLQENGSWKTTTEIVDNDDWNEEMEEE